MKEVLPKENHELDASPPEALISGLCDCFLKHYAEKIVGMPLYLTGRKSSFNQYERLAKHIPNYGPLVRQLRGICETGLLKITDEDSPFKGTDHSDKENGSAARALLTTIYAGKIQAATTDDIDTRKLKRDMVIWNMWQELENIGYDKERIQTLTLEKLLTHILAGRISLDNV